MSKTFETDSDPLWDNFVSDWQTADSESHLEEEMPNNDVLIRQLKKEIKSDFMITLLGLATGLLMSLYIISEIIKGLPSILDVIFYYGILSIIVLMIVANIWIKRSNWKAQSSDTKSYIERSLSHVNTQLKINLSAKIACIAFLLLCYSIIGWILLHWFIADKAIAKPILASLIVGFISLFFPILLYFIHKIKMKLEIQKQSLISMIKSLT